MTTVHRLRELRQTVWLDFLDRALLASGELDRMIARDGLAGMTSNPTIFQRAIAGSGDYDDAIRSAPPSESDAMVLERIAVNDVTRACDHLRSAYDSSGGADGFVSIEVSPELAHDPVRTEEEAHRLWTAVARPNLMVKIPGTHEALPAIEHSLTRGISVNVTLLFSVSRYLKVADAFLRALEVRAGRRQQLEHVASVASFFVSRVDAKVDAALDALPAGLCDRARLLRGRIAIANAAAAYVQYRRITSHTRWQALAAKGARPQRLLWASTSTKDPAYPDVYYADALVAPDTIDTMTLETFRAYLDHGRPEETITRAMQTERDDLSTLVALGVDFEAITQQLEDEGVQAFAEAYRKTLRTIDAKRRVAGTAAHATA